MIFSADLARGRSPRVGIESIGALYAIAGTADLLERARRTPAASLRLAAVDVRVDLPRREEAREPVRDVAVEFQPHEARQGPDRVRGGCPAVSRQLAARRGVAGLVRALVHRHVIVLSLRVECPVAVGIVVAEDQIYRSVGMRGDDVPPEVLVGRVCDGEHVADVAARGVVPHFRPGQLGALLVWRAGGLDEARTALDARACSAACTPGLRESRAIDAGGRGLNSRVFAFRAGRAWSVADRVLVRARRAGDARRVDRLPLGSEAPQRHAEVGGKHHLQDDGRGEGADRVRQALRQRPAAAVVGGGAGVGPDAPALGDGGPGPAGARRGVRRVAAAVCAHAKVHGHEVALKLGFELQEGQLDARVRELGGNHPPELLVVLVAKVAKESGEIRINLRKMAGWIFAVRSCAKGRW